MEELVGDEAVQLFMNFSRSDFVGGIDNEALDFSQLEDYINDETDSSNTYFGSTLAHTGNVAPVVVSVGVGVEGGSSTLHIPATANQVAHHASFPANNTPSNGVPVPVPGTDSTNNFSHPHNLPESPPDSGSEPPYSPQDPNVHSPHQKPNVANCNANLQDLLLQSGGLGFGKAIPAANEAILVQHSPALTPLLTQQQVTQHAPLSPIGLSANGTTTIGIPAQTHNGISSPESPNITTVYTPLHTTSTKKRKLSQDNPNILVKQEPAGTVFGATELSPDANSNHTALGNSSGLSNIEDDYSYQEGSGGAGSDTGMYLDSNFQCIRFQPFQQTAWHSLCDQNLKELPTPHYRVDADKGFNFSNADDAFVCQKKNHFQITCHTQLQGDAQFVKTPEGLRKICNFHLHFYGVKVESPSQTIKVEQSQSDRSKKAFHPVLVDLHGEQVTKVTVGRLHFSETTSNNMRKKGKPNPDQRYFYLVVGLHAHCNDNSHYPIVSHASERIIVRAFLFQASNPGQFESDVELCWQRGSSPESVFHAGRVGINTDRPDEALVVHGNVKISGHIIQPSDARAKQDIEICDTREQLRNVQQLSVVKFKYTPEFASHFGLVSSGDTGIIAQEVQKVLPEAVTMAGDVTLADGTKYDNFLVVNKERIFMENVGAVKELCKVTDNLETRIGQLERINKRLIGLKRGDSLKSIASSISFRKNGNISKKKKQIDNNDFCSNRVIQCTIVILILIMTLCLFAMAALYFFEYTNRSGVEHPVHFSQKFGGPWLRPAANLPNWGYGQNSSYIYHSNYTNYIGRNQPDKSPSKNFSRFRSTAQPYNSSEFRAGSNSQLKHSKHNSKMKLGHSTASVSVDETKDHTEDLLTPSSVVPLGRPLYCERSQTPLQFLSESAYPTLCQEAKETFCCLPALHNSGGDENSGLSQSTSNPKPDVPPENHNFGRQIQITPATNALEDHPGSGSGDSVKTITADNLLKKEAPSWHETKSSIEYLARRKRKRRNSEEWSDRDVFATSVQNSDADQNGVLMQVRGPSFNETIGLDYCNVVSPEYNLCLGRSATNLSYAIPLSKYLADPVISVVFKFTKDFQGEETVRFCPVPGGRQECPVSRPEHLYNSSQADKLVEQDASGQIFNIDISSSLFATFRYRIPRIQTNHNVCNIPGNKLGASFLEYNIYFYRDCEG
nr:PREDICTED: myelin regulatory factor isoform X1 [Bemisia tabaci]